MKASDGRPVSRIGTQDELEAACDGWLRGSSLAIDTEFVRTNTFYPKPGLLQLADELGTYLVDPLAIDSWDCFLDLLQNPQLEFILHSAGEDLSLMLSLFGTLPAGIFDTQLAAAYAGLGFSLSYQALVEQMLAIHVPKGETRSDWLRRPLSEEQLQYAASDVCYLLPLQDALALQMNDRGTREWFEADCLQAMQVARQQEDPDTWKTLYADVSNAWRLSDVELTLLQQLCYWRETEARRRNKPRNWIAKDAELTALARSLAETQSPSLESLTGIQELDRGFRKRYGESLLARLNDPIELGGIDRSLLSPPLPPKYRDTLKKWRHVVQEKAESLGIASELLARKKWMHELLKGFERTGELNWQPPMQGWRRELLETDFASAVPKSSGK